MFSPTRPILSRLVPLTFLALLLPPPIAAAQSDFDGVVAGDEPAVLVVDEGQPLVEAAVADENPRGRWQAVSPREVDGHVCYSRQSSDAFDDPDARTNLEIKYYFELPDETLPRGNLTRWNDGEPAETIRLQLPPLRGASREGLEGEVVIELPVQPDEPAAEIEWLDYETQPKPKTAVVWLPPQAPGGPTSLYVVPVAAGQGPLKLGGSLARRSIGAEEVPEHYLPGGLLDTWDRPRSLGHRGNFFGRVIAMLKHVDGRYAVDFYGEVLHEESDCRVWLTPDEHPWGRPVAIRFIELPILRTGGDVSEVTVLGVQYETPDGGSKVIAFDYPLCSPPILEQLRKLAAGAQSGGSRGGSAPDLGRLIGEDVLDEFSRRLVDGKYHDPPR